MAETVKLNVRYFEAKDALYMRVIPSRLARMAETDYDFYIRYDWDDPSRIVGFEWLGFSTYFGAIDEPGVIPELDLRFEVSGMDLWAATLKEVLRWAYQKYVLKRETPVPAQVPVAQG